MKLGMIVYNNELQIKYEFRCYWSIFERVMSPWTYNFHENLCFRTFFELNFQMLKRNLVWLFTILSYRSSLSFIVIDQYLSELWALGLKILTKICFPDIFGLIFQILKWNLVWLFTILSYRSSLSFVIIDLYLSELWALGLRIFMKFSVFWISFLINFSDIEMKLCKIVYGNELQINF
jgi:hypothetical protein